MQRSAADRPRDLACRWSSAIGRPPTGHPPAERRSTRSKYAFAGRTRAPGEFLNVKYQVTSIASGLFHLGRPAPARTSTSWSGDGKLRIFKDGKTRSRRHRPAGGGRLQGDCSISSSTRLRKNKTIWTGYAEPRDNGNTGGKEALTGRRPNAEGQEGQVMYRRADPAVDPALRSDRHRPTAPS